MSEITPERFSDLIGSIYDCVLAPDRWGLVLAEIVKEFNFETCALSVHDVVTNEMQVHVTVGLSQRWIDLGFQHAAAVAEIWGGATGLASGPLEEPIMLSDTTPRSRWADNSYYQAILKPMGIHDIAAIGLVRDSRNFGVLGLGQSEQNGEVVEAAKSGLRLLAPHLRRAVVIGRLFEQEALAAATFSDVLEDLAAGIVLVDEDMGIVHANTAAQRMLAKGDPVQSHSGKLFLQNTITNSVLVNAVSQAALNESSIERRSIDIPARRMDGTPTVIQVLPLRRRAIKSGLEQRAAAAVFVANAADPPRLPADAMGLIYDLTPAETRVFELIVEGKAPADIAKHLGVGLPTVRTHLSRVFEKTGCTRQADLVALASNVALVV